MIKIVYIRMINSQDNLGRFSFFFIKFSYEHG